MGKGVVTSSEQLCRLLSFKTKFKCKLVMNGGLAIVSLAFRKRMCQFVVEHICCILLVGRGAGGTSHLQ